jgi:hypothetical protein
LVSAALVSAVGLYNLHPVDPQRLKAPGFNPCTYEVSENLVSKFGFSNATCTAYSAARGDLAVESAALPAVGLCSLNQVDP